MALPFTNRGDHGQQVVGAAVHDEHKIVAHQEYKQHWFLHRVSTMVREEGDPYATTASAML